MKDTKKAVLEGVIAGVSAILIWQLVSDSDLQRQLSERIKNMAGSVRRQTGLLDEKAMLKRAQLTNDPGVNQRWVENQWNALT